MDVEDSASSDGRDGHERGEERTRFFFSRGRSSCKVAFASVGRLGTVRRALCFYPFSCMSSVVAPIQKSSDAFKINTARIRKRGEQCNDGSGLLFVCVSRYRFTAVFAIWGNWSVVPIVKCCTVATAAGLKQPTEEQPRAYWI